MLCLRFALAATVAAAFLLIILPIAAPASGEATDKARRFVESHTARLRPLEVAAAIAWWEANNSGKDADFERKEKTQNAIDQALADPKVFAELKALKRSALKSTIRSSPVPSTCSISPTSKNRWM